MTPETLETATGCSPRVALAIVDELTAAMTRYGIDTPLRQAHFLAQCAHESALFVRVEENLNYSAIGLTQTWPNRFYLSPQEARGRIDAATLAHRPDAIANAVYGDRLGNTQPGDGWRFRGRGLIQTTGRGNYEAFNRAEPTIACVTYPDHLCTPQGAALSAAWFWQQHECNDAADADIVGAVTQKINGGQTGITERQALTARAKRALGI